MQNCVIFNDKVFDNIAGRDVREDKLLKVEHGKPMIFGSEKNKGLVLKDFDLQVVTIGENGITEKDILVHDRYTDNIMLHTMLAKLVYPTVIGVIRSVKSATYDDLMEEQIEQVKAKSPIKCMDDLLNSGDTWEI
jgi:2-oxoglutarate ferredoxin oxidoreductase subunit beta